jgi:hypothetical protein
MPRTATRSFRNLSRVAEDCSEVWLAEPPQPSYGDTWVSAELDGDEIEAHSWSGYVVRLDLATGTERSTTFHK